MAHMSCWERMRLVIVPLNSVGVSWLGMYAVMLEMIRVALELVGAGLLEGFDAAHQLVNFYFYK